MESLDDVKSVDDAKRVLVAAGKDGGVGEVGWVVWCAGEYLSLRNDGCVFGCRKTKEGS